MSLCQRERVCLWGVKFEVCRGGDACGQRTAAECTPCVGRNRDAAQRNRGHLVQSARPHHRRAELRNLFVHRE